jgi:hypothetical protein
MADLGATSKGRGGIATTPTPGIAPTATSTTGHTGNDAIPIDRIGTTSHPVPAAFTATAINTAADGSWS